MLAFIVFESMLFAGLLGGYVTLRWGSASWPPAGQPYLPLAITWLNTLCLLGSCVPLHLASRGFRMSNLRPFTRADSPSSPSVARDLRPPIRLLVLAACMGGVFLGIQGYEWARLLAHGMTIARGTYGGLFLILIGTHGAHVLAAVLWLAIVALLAAAGRITPARRAVLDISTMYWYFVCAVWIVLFTLVYLA